MGLKGRWSKFLQRLGIEGVSIYGLYVYKYAKKLVNNKDVSHIANYDEFLMDLFTPTPPSLYHAALFYIQYMEEHFDMELADQQAFLNY